MFTPQEQLDNLIRWRDELASGKWQKCEGMQSDTGGISFCAYGVAYRAGIGETGDDVRAATGMIGDQYWDREQGFLCKVWAINDRNPGDNFAAVIEYLNEEITRRKVALGVPVTEEVMVTA